MRAILVILFLLACARSGRAVELLSLTNVWRYNQSGEDLGSAWKEPEYDDAQWPLGYALLAWETSDNTFNRQNIYPFTNTILRLGPITYYFRAHIFVTNPVAAFSIVASNLIDDGAVVYVNGNEIYRYNMPEGPVGAGTTALIAGETRYFVTNFPGSALIEGNNVIAVEVHQGSYSSSDVVFGLSLHYVPFIGDPENPKVLFADMGVSFTNVLVTFSVPVDPSSAVKPSNYLIQSETGHELNVLSAALAGPDQVQLTTEARANGPRYILHVNNVAGELGSLRFIPRRRTIGYVIPWDAFDTEGPRLMWKYSALAAQTTSAWKLLSFDDRAWPLGQSGFGFDDGPTGAEYIRTPLPRWLEPCCTNQIITYYFRAILTNAGSIQNIHIRGLIDDGAVFYWNGLEMMRLRMPSGLISHNTFATQSVEAQFDGPLTLVPRFMYRDTNVFAVEVHKAAALDEDLIFALDLSGNIPSEPYPPRLKIERWSDGPD